MYREIARHSARLNALRAARCADGSRPIPTNFPEMDFFYTLNRPSDFENRKGGLLFYVLNRFTTAHSQLIAAAASPG